MCPRLSIVIPAYNEAARLPLTLQSLALWNARNAMVDTEVIVVDHGSRDNTSVVAETASLPVEIVPAPRHVGVGGAMRRGVMRARGERVLLCDADGAVSFDNLPRLCCALDAGYDVAVGSRSARSDNRRTRARRITARLWRNLAHVAVPQGVGDTQCGFKLFTRAAAYDLFSTALCRSFAVHVEILARAEDMGLRVAEVPVIWRDVAGSQVRLWRDPWCMASDLLRVGWRRRRNPSWQRVPV